MVIDMGEGVERHESLRGDIKNICMVLTTKQIKHMNINKKNI